MVDLLPNCAARTVQWPRLGRPGAIPTNITLIHIMTLGSGVTGHPNREPLNGRFPTYEWRQGNNVTYYAFLPVFYAL